MLNLYAVVKDRWSSEDQIFLSYLIGSGSIFAAIEPHKVHDAGAVGEVGHDALFARAHGEGLEAQVILQQVTIGFDAELLAQHLLAVGTYARQVHDVLVEYCHFPVLQLQ